MSKLLEAIQQSKAISPLLNKKGRFCVDDTIGISLLVSAAYYKNNDKIIIVAPNLYNAQTISTLVSDYIGEENVLLFPADELIRSEELTSSKEFVAQRLYVLGELLSRKHLVVVVHSTSLMRFLPPIDLFKSLFLDIKIGDHIDLETLKQTLSRAGYLRVNKIDQSLQYASRGDIFDIFSVNKDRPIRIEFFDDEVESIKYFDIATQSSDISSSLNEIKIYPASDILYKDQEINDLKIDMLKQIEDDKEFYKEKYELVKDNFLSDFEFIQNHIPSSRLYKYYSYAKNNNVASILDYAGKDSLVVISNEEQFNKSSMLVYEESARYLMELVQEARIPARLQMYRSPEYLFSSAKNVVYGDTYQLNPSEPVFVTRPIVYAGTSVSQIEPTIRGYISHSSKVIIALTNAQQLNTVIDILKENKIDYEELTDIDIPKRKVGVLIKSIDEGFEIPDLKISLITSKELFGQIYKNVRFSNRFKEATILKSADDLQPGDYVVHEYRGIGKFLGVETIAVDGNNRDFLHIQYAGSDELFVPLTQFKLVRKYAGREGAVPKLNRLSGNEWNKTKAKIKTKVNELAQKLLALYSERVQVQGFAFNLDDELQEMFESQFPYELTQDQKEALSEIKKEMEKPYPMDRLLCGDVGFGKTEVAFRAAFKAINSGKQVALLCPTTLLARQHYEVAKERFLNFGVKIAIFSRLVPEKEQKQYIEEIKQGKIHLIIGTHRLLSKQIEYNDLGLLIVDEEQRFGVEQKEKIKELKSNVDVLTLSATPIPRTLQMSLVGLRGFSQINTAPGSRMPIQTYVVQYDKEVIKELIERELGRHGQVFYLYNKVSDIYLVASRIREQVKNASIGVVHGQMSKDEIEDVMLNFYNGEINVLVCTTIIENGIDVPNANLIIVEDADSFGLSQLYQIKGRVGRGDRIAYAYLMYRANRIVNNENARKRLKAIQEFTELGSGYKIAQRDLMIRGAGDILGAEQAGYIDSVGIDLYMKMLQDAVKGKKTEIEEQEPNKMLSINAYIPQNYANNPDKIELYQDLENARSIQEVNNIKNKMRDVYGRLPKEVSNLILKRKIDIFYESPVFDDMKEYPQGIDLYLSNLFSEINGIGAELFDILSPYVDFIKVTYINRVLKIRVDKVQNWEEQLEKIMSKIVKLYFSKITH